jgi:hypothetical protein
VATDGSSALLDGSSKERPADIIHVRRSTGVENIQAVRTSAEATPVEANPSPHHNPLPARAARAARRTTASRSRGQERAADNPTGRRSLDVFRKNA